MTAALTDRDMLVRTLHMVQDGQCCEFFACPGPDKRPVPMASCAQATAAWELREYLQRHGGWCPEHGQDLGQCHNPRDHRTPHTACSCAPVNRS